jgi:hypothetical protein
MKSLKLKSKWVSLLSITGIVAALVMALAAAPAGIAYADAATPPAKLSQARDNRLERWYQREQDWLTQQQDNLNKANTIVTKVQAFIAAQEANGKDVTALQTALAAFQQQIANAQAAHSTAASILSAHAGFDANGHVTDATQAHQTLMNGRQSLRDAHLMIKQAVLDLHRAIRDWRQANNAQPTTSK